MPVEIAGECDRGDRVIAGDLEAAAVARRELGALAASAAAPARADGVDDVLGGEVVPGGELGAAARFGIVRMHGEALPGSRVAGDRGDRLAEVARGGAGGDDAELGAGAQRQARQDVDADGDVGGRAEPGAELARAGAWTSLALGAVLEL